MKEVNGIPVYEEEDICALDEYSKQLEEALTPKFQNIEDNIIESTEKILELEKESDDQKDTTELLKLQVEELKNENTQLKNQIPTGTAEGESIYLSDSSDLEAKIIVKGNSKQEGTPTLENKIDIETLGNNINFINLEDVSETIKNGITYSITNGIIKLNGTVTQSFNLYLENSFDIQAGDYTLSNNFQGTYSGVVGHYIYDYPSLAIKLDGGTINGSNKTKILEQSKVIYGLYFTSGAVLNNVILKPKLEKGTKATTYSSYNIGSAKINISNKQLFNIRDLIAGMGTLNLDEDDFVRATFDNSTGTSTKYYNIYTNASKLIKSNTKYYLILEIKEVSGTGILYSHSTGTDYISQFVGQTSYNFDDIKNENIIIEEITSFENINSSTVMLRTFLGFKAGQSGSITFRMSVLEQKPDINTFKYVKHQSQIKILPIQEEMLEDDDLNNEREYHTWGKYVFTGNETILNVTSVGNNNRHIVQIQGMISVDKAYCNYFKFLKNYTSDTEHFYTSTNQIIFFTSLTGSDFKTWLQEKYNSGNPVVVHYKLAAPKSLPLTEEQKNILDEKTYTYKNVTNINTDSIAILDVTYKKDLETLLMR